MWNILISFSNDATALFGIASSASPKTTPEPFSDEAEAVFKIVWQNVSLREKLAEA